MLGSRSWDEWVRQYARSHQNGVNRACHTIGIPIIALSVLLSPLIAFRHSLWMVFAAAFVLGWTIQFIGHAVEGKRPEFFEDWRYLFVGLRWWFAKLAGKA